MQSLHAAPLEAPTSKVEKGENKELSGCRAWLLPVFGSVEGAVARDRLR